MKKSLTKKQILRLKKDINRVFETGTGCSLSFMRIIKVNNGLSYSRMIVIPVKHYGNSVQRNHIRRQIRELWRTNIEEIMNGYDCVFIVYKHSSVEFSGLKNLFLALLSKSGIYEKNYS